MEDTLEISVAFLIELPPNLRTTVIFIIYTYFTINI